MSLLKITESCITYCCICDECDISGLSEKFGFESLLRIKCVTPNVVSVNRLNEAQHDAQCLNVDALFLLSPRGAVVMVTQLWIGHSVLTED